MVSNKLFNNRSLFLVCFSVLLSGALFVIKNNSYQYNNIINSYKPIISNENEAIEYLKKNIREKKLSAYWLSSCVVYWAEERQSEWIVEIHEVHNKECGGSPGTIPLVALFKINKASNEIFRYDIIDDRYILIK